MNNQATVSVCNPDPGNALGSAVGGGPVTTKLIDGEIFQRPNSRLVFEPADCDIALG